MKTIYKLLLTGLLCFSTLTAMAVTDNNDSLVASAVQMAEHHGQKCRGDNPPVVNFQSVKICRIPGAFVAIDSVECSVHLVKKVMKHDTIKKNDKIDHINDYWALDTVAVFQTDNIHKRHDLKNILRPVSPSVR